LSAVNGHSIGADESDDISSYRVVWFADLGKARHQDHLVKNLLLANTLFVVYGESNSGKTFFMLDLALAIAGGAPWRGRRTKPGGVIYVAGEGANSVRNRVAAYRMENPSVQGGIPFAMITHSVDFLKQDSIDSLILTLQLAERECGVKVELIVIDTFARAMAGGDENSARDVGMAVAAADYVRLATGACVGFIHHAGKDATKGARGSSALRAAVDTEILIEGTQGPRTATVVKQRDLESGQSMPFELISVQLDFDAEDNTPITSCVVRHLDGSDVPVSTAPAIAGLKGRAQRQFLAALRARKTPDIIYSMTELRLLGKEIGLSKSTAWSAVDAIVATPYMQATLGGYRFTDGSGPKHT
jgi:hypothetical protein